MNWKYLRAFPSLDTRASHIARTPLNGSLLDLGSSDGETLNHIAELRPDLRLHSADKFGHPEKYFTKTGDYRGMVSLWWIDPVKEKALEEAIKSGASLPVGETLQRPWD